MKKLGLGKCVLFDTADSIVFVEQTAYILYWKGLHLMRYSRKVEGFVFNML